uniref:Uncharacterized protein n=1 Tax=Craspedostauros australis TaxID=1486917 RepID=A0A6T6HJM2_9STRA|mmetsp:Transcript_5284/g.14284  ORF Transcript_5284/g.14284 Transcript_5284/m.14284 type:complete len:101 (+) Transcript_5284:2650-2952(+)
MWRVAGCEPSTDVAICSLSCNLAGYDAAQNRLDGAVERIASTCINMPDRTEKNLAQFGTEGSTIDVGLNGERERGWLWMAVGRGACDGRWSTRKLNSKNR